MRLLFLSYFTLLILVIAEKPLRLYSTVISHKFKTHHEFDEEKQFFSNQTKLINHLFEDYNRNIPAIYTRDRYGGQARSLRCNTTLFYVKLLTIEETKQLTQMIIDIIYRFVDPRLTWNPEHFDGIEEIVMSKKETIWIPDVLPYDIMSYIESVPEDRQIIFFNGTVSFYSTAVTEFICHLKLADFPFDVQSCDYRLTSFNAPVTELSVMGMISDEINKNAGNGEWTFLGVSVENSFYEGPYNFQYSVVIFRFDFRRSTTYYYMLIIIPSFVLVILCLSGLFWRSIEKDSYMENVRVAQNLKLFQLNLGLTAILAMMLIMQMSTENMPKINEVNKLSRYSMINLGLITLASLVNMCLGKMEVYKKKNELMKEIEAGGNYSKLLTLKCVLLKRLHLFLLTAFNILCILNLFLLIS